MVVVLEMLLFFGGMAVVFFTLQRMCYEEGEMN